MNQRLAPDPDDGRPVTIVLRGEYDLARREELERELGAAQRADSVVVDMSAVTYVDSTALTCFVRLRKRMIEHGQGTIRIAGARPQVRRVFQVTNLDQIFSLDPNS